MPCLIAKISAYVSASLITPVIERSRTILANSLLGGQLEGSIWSELINVVVMVPRCIRDAVEVLEELDDPLIHGGVCRVG